MMIINRNRSQLLLGFLLFILNINFAETMSKFLLTTMYLFLLSVSFHRLYADNLDSLRILYYQSVENKDALNEAFDKIRYMRERRIAPEALLNVYEGSLLGLEGKHARSVRKKYDYVMEALPVMENARKADSLNVEILFIQGTTTYYLPFFFGQAKRAEKNFHLIIRLLPDVHHKYPVEIVKNVIEFLKENAHLCPDETNCLNDLLNVLGNEYES